MMAVIRKLNYQHLLYFWSVVRTGSLTQACEELALTHPSHPASRSTRTAIIWVPVRKRGWRATLAKTLRRGFLKSLNGMPVLLPTDDTAIRRALDQWFAQHDVHPVVIGEFEDYALLREFARAGHGFAPVPVVMEEQFRRQYDFGRIGLADTDLRILRDLFGTQDQTSCAGGDGRERTPDLLQLNAA